jgi:hypothetical protein
MALFGSVTVWSSPALTVGAVLTPLRRTTTSSDALSAPSLAVRRRT